MKMDGTRDPQRRGMRESFDLGSSGLVRRAEARSDERSGEPWEFTWNRRPVILLAEDDGAMRSLLLAQLRRSGYRVIACQDGAELVQRISVYRSHRVPLGVDLVITDVRMPFLSGLELLDLVREAALRIPVILISAFGDIETRSEAAKRNAAAFFSKPFDVDELCLAVRSNLRAST